MRRRRSARRSWRPLLSLVVIFVPVAFMTGQIGRYFYSFGITSAAAILISMFISFTLTPALCAMWLKKEDTQIGPLHDEIQRLYAKLDAAYGRMLDLVASPPRRDAGHRRRSRRIGRLSVPHTSARNWCRTTIRASSAVNVRLPRGTSLPAHRRIRQADRAGDPGASAT